MSASRWIARLIVTVYAVVAVPASMLLLGHASTTWRTATAQFGQIDASLLTSPQVVVPVLGAGGAGLLLLVGVVLSGIASSSWLFVAGLYGIGSVLLAIFPSLNLAFYDLILGQFPLSASDAQLVGIPLVVQPLMLGLGVAVLLARRLPPSGAVTTVLGFLLIPVLLLLGWVVTMSAAGRGQWRVFLLLDTEFSLLVAALALLGSGILVAAGAASRWSPFALIVPAMVSIAATVAFPFLLRSVSMTGVRGPEMDVVLTFLGSGGGVTWSLVLLAAAGTIAIVRHRAMRVRREVEAEASVAP